MDTLLVCAGSEVKGVELDAGSAGVVHVRFSAACVQRVAPGALRPADEGYLRPLELVFHGAQVKGDLPAALGTLAEAELRHRGKPWRQPLLPLRLQGGVSAELVFRNGTVLRVEAESATCAPGPGTVFQESLAC
jgi:hypothetical protein